MPENITNVLEALAAEGRELTRPLPAAAIEAQGRARHRRRQRLTVATSGALACAVAVGIVVATSGAKSSSPTPAGNTPSPTTVKTTQSAPSPTAPSSTAQAVGPLPDSAWLTSGQIPFATADKSAGGWVMVMTMPPSPGGTPPTDLCAAGSGIVDGLDSTVESHAFHGTPKELPVDPVTQELYSSAGEDIHTFTTPADASAAFDYAKTLTTLHSCKVPDPNGGGPHNSPLSRTVTTGAVTATGFSVAMEDTPGPSYSHLYVVIKGSRIAVLGVFFEHGDNTTDGDAAVLAAMASRLP